MSGQQPRVYTLEDARLTIVEMENILMTLPSDQSIDKIGELIRKLDVDQLKNILASRSITTAGSRRKLESRVFNGFIDGMIKSNIITDQPVIQGRTEERRLELRNIIFEANQKKIDTLQKLDNTYLVVNRVEPSKDNILKLYERLKSYLAQSAQDGNFNIEVYTAMIQERNILYDRLYELGAIRIKSRIRVIGLTLNQSQLRKNYLLNVDPKILHLENLKFSYDITNDVYRFLGLVIDDLSDNSNPMLLQLYQGLYDDTRNNINSYVTFINNIGAGLNEARNQLILDENREPESNDSNDYIDDNIDLILRNRDGFDEPDYGFDNTIDPSSLHNLQFDPSSYDGNWLIDLRSYGLVVLKIPNFNPSNLSLRDIVGGISDNLMTISDNSIIIGDISLVTEPMSSKGNRSILNNYRTAQNPDDNNFSTIKVVIFLEDSGPEDGGFSYIERSQSSFSNYVFKRKIEGEDPNIVDGYDGLYSQYKKIKLCIRAGYMVLFDARLAHMVIPSKDRDIVTATFTIRFD